MLVEDNFRVGTTGRRKQLLDDIKAESPANYVLKAFDIRLTDKIESSLNDLVVVLGGLDLLIISSGTGDINIELEVEKKRLTPMFWALQLLRTGHLIISKIKNRVIIVGITSIGGLRRNRQSPSYSATKAFQINYLESLRIKEVNLNIPIFRTDIRP